MPVNNVSPPLGGVSNAVNTSICIPPAPVTLSMLTVESIVILALAVPGFVTLTDMLENINSSLMRITGYINLLNATMMVDSLIVYDG